MNNNSNFCFVDKKNSLSGIKLIYFKNFQDNRGYFTEIWNEKVFYENLGVKFVQDNISHSYKKTLRGLHYQIKNPQGKFIKVIEGSIIDIIFDLRINSKTFFKYDKNELNKDGPALYIPPGIAHGFYAKENSTIFYKVTDIYDPSSERTLFWNDNTTEIDLNTEDKNLIISKKDEDGKSIRESLNEILTTKCYHDLP